MMNNKLPWAIGKAFDFSAPMGPITPKAQVKGIEDAKISLSVNGVQKQNSHITKLIWNIEEIVHHLSLAWELQPGDLIYTGTPQGMGAVVRGDLMSGSIEGLGSIDVKVV